MKPCHECGGPTPTKGSRRCDPCHRVYFPVMEFAITRVNFAVRHGHLPRLRDNPTPCVDCGLRATLYEHRDYTRKLDVEPVCRKCNVKRGPAKPLPSYYFPAKPWVTA